MRALPRCLLLALSLWAGAAGALELRSVEPAEGAAVAILYDTPSKQGKKLFLIRRYTPVEQVVSLEGWSKVRDAEGTLAWIEKKSLSERRTVQINVDRAQVRQAADSAAAQVFEAERGVALEVIEAPATPAAATGWIKVRHPDGANGFVRANQVWGL
jgi:SH3-like domain-containing protein